MSSITISTRTLAELVIGGLLVFATTWVVRSGAVSTASTSNPGALDPHSAEAGSSSAKSKSKKKKAKGAANGGSEPTQTAEAAPAPPAPAQVAQLPAAAAETGSKKKPKSAKQSNGAHSPAASAPAPTPAPAPAAASTPAAAPSFAAAAAPTPTSPPSAQAVPISHPPVTQQRSRKLSNSTMPSSPVDDMVERDGDGPGSARVMRVMGGKLGALPPVGEWEDWHTRQDEDNGWEVASKKKPKASAGSSASGYAASAFASSNPAPAAKLIPGLTSSAQDAMTKKQRDNEKKKQKEKADKEAAENDRLVRLAEHRRSQEKARAVEAEKQRNKNAPSNKKTGPRSESFKQPKATSGGMSASLDDDGHLIWD